MKIVITVGGQFHAFELARQLEKRGYLEQLITGYPVRRPGRFDLPPGKVVSLPAGQLIYRGWQRLPPAIRGLGNPVFRVSELFDRRASRRLAGGDLLIGWSSFSLHTLREAKRRGMKTVLERGSSHILFQREILEEEYELLGCSGELPHSAIVEKELREYAEADYIEVPSSFVRESFIRQGIPGEKIIRGFRGVDLDQFRQIPGDDSIFRVIFAGKICLRKGIQYLLRAFSDLALPRSELLLIGAIADEARPVLSRYRGTFRCLGSQPRSELPRFFSRGSVFVMPSIEEGMAVVQLQAMACGLPLICTTNTGGEDLIEDGVEGFIVSIRDVEAIKEKLLLLYREPERRKDMGEMAKSKVTRGFSWDDYGDRVTGEYRRIIGESGR
ncbi:MAG: glycosyltransferase family 4 protein [Candidatus Erginobacter occultus]|nr:glycosyltransferase family 4 protein [Candidatus Erginobacter occultus]